MTRYAQSGKCWQRCERRQDSDTRGGRAGTGSGMVPITVQRISAWRYEQRDP